MASHTAEAVTRQIRDSVDIVDLVGEHVSLKRRGANFLGLCPFHQEKTPSFNVHPSMQIFKCFGCGVGGDVYTFVQLRENVEFLEARRMLAARAGIDLDERTDGGGGGPNRKSVLFEANEWAQQQFRKWYDNPEQGRVAREYVEGRQLSLEVVASFGLGFAPDSWDALQRAGGSVGFDADVLVAAGLLRARSSGSGFRDTFHNRLMFPIWDPSSRLVGFGGRTLGDDRAKYLNTPETAIFDKGRNLYGLNMAREGITSRGRVIMVEGYTDCMMAHQFGFTETVATLGTALTADHVRLLRRYTDNAYLVFDSDEAGSRAADRGLEVFLTQQLDVKLVQVPQGKDPCDFLLAQGGEAFGILLNQALSALEFKWGSVLQRYGDADSGPARREAIDEFLRLVATSAVFGAVDPIQRGLVVNQLAKLLGIGPEELHRQIGGLRRRVASRAANTRRRDSETDVQEDQPTEASNDAEQHALREIMEALVGEPGYCDRVREWFDPNRIVDSGLREVSATVFAMADELGEFTVGELITRMREARYAQIITDLYQAGRDRRNNEATIELNRRRLEEMQVERRTRETAERLLRNQGELSEEDQNSLLEAVGSHVKQRKSFVPLSMTRGRERTIRPQGSAGG